MNLYIAICWLLTLVTLWDIGRRKYASDALVSRVASAEKLQAEFEQRLKTMANVFAVSLDDTKRELRKELRDFTVSKPVATINRSPFGQRT